MLEPSQHHESYNTFHISQPKPNLNNSGVVEYLRNDFYNTTKQSMVEVLSTQHNVDLLLSMNTNNRKLQRKQVLVLKSEIISGSWKPVSTIVVSDNGILLDGQHRLYALREANYPSVRFWLHLGVPESYRIAIDQGKARSYRDALSFEGLDSNPKIISAIRFLNRINPDNFTKKSPKDTNRADGNFFIEISPTKLLRLYNDFSEVIYPDALEAYFKRTNNLRIIPIFTALYQYSAVDPDRAKAISDQLATGENLTDSSPILHFRNFVMKSDSVRKAGNYISIYRRLVSAILHEHNGQSVSRLLPEAKNWDHLQDQIWMPSF